MNYGFRYQAADGHPYTVDSLAAGPWTRMVIEAALDFVPEPDLRIDPAAILAAPGTGVEELFSYVSIGRVQRGRDSFDAIAELDKVLTASGSIPEGDIFDIDFWIDRVQSALAMEIDTQATAGFTGIFLDDFDRYLINKDRVEAQIGGVFDADPLRNAALAAMDAAVTLATEAPDLDFLVNVNAFLLSSHVRFGEGGVFSEDFEDEIDAFAAAIDGVVIENYWESACGEIAEDFLSAVAAFAEEGILVHTSHIFEPATAADDINAYYAHAAARGYIPTATTSELFDRFDPAVPVFNEATAEGDVLLATDRKPVNGGEGNDTMFGSEQGDALSGGEGRDNINGRAGADFIEAGEGRDRAAGGKQRDVILGESGADRLFGNGGNDILRGGSGNDTLKGGNGDDLLIGGTGRDTFFWREEGSDVITDFEIGVDLFAYVGRGPATTEHWSSHATQVGAHVVVDPGGDDVNTLTILNVELEALSMAT